MSTSDLAGASQCVELAQEAMNTAATQLAGAGDIDHNQQVAYDLAHGASAISAARSMLAYGARGEQEAAISCAFVADALADIEARVLARENLWGLRPGWMESAMGFMRTWRDPSLLASLATSGASRHLDPDFEMVRETFHRFTEERVLPYADDVHRNNSDVPEEVIKRLAQLGGFGLSIPEEYGGLASGDESDYLGMIIATEELSWASLGIGGSLITRPEILARALLKGGTDEQRKNWLPRLASGETMVAVAVTEPDFGSDVANLVTSATRGPGGWVVNGVKTWCTFAARADVLMLLARTNPDRSQAHRGLSLFLVPKPRGEGHGFSFLQGENAADAPAHDGSPGKMEGRAIDTIGYRGMHSYEVSFANWWIPDDCLIGGEPGLGRGFYYQMQGFENGRLQTAARALGVMQAAYEAALSYSRERVVFGRPTAEYQLTQVKLTRMAVLIQAIRQFSYEVARLMANGEGALEASMVKAYACRAAEWVTREAMQMHGGMGYAEEFPVSRYFVDARVLSIFEGADETLALKVIARRLIENASQSSTEC
ncbi:MAG: acyl-CoA dehydrogenase family protein [Acidimicrobiales bacterium]